MNELMTALGYVAIGAFCGLCVAFLNALTVAVTMRCWRAGEKWWAVSAVACGLVIDVGAIALWLRPA